MKINPVLLKQLNADFDAGNHTTVWNAYEGIASHLITSDLLRMGLRSLVALGRAGDVVGISLEVIRCNKNLCSKECVQTVLQVLGGSQTSLIADAERVFCDEIGSEEKSRELLLIAYAQSDDLSAVRRLRREGVSCSAKAYAKLVKEGIRRGELEESEEIITSMVRDGYYIPTAALIQLLKVGERLSRTDEVFQLFRKIDLSPDGVTGLFEHAARNKDVQMADNLLKIYDGSNKLDAPCLQSLVRVFVTASDVRACEYALRLCAMGPSESTIVGLIRLSGEVQNVPLAEQFHRHLGMTASSCNAIIRVHWNSRMYTKACDVYTKMCEAKIEPDVGICHCLAPAALACGRVALAREVLRHAQADVHNYMGVFRAYAREKKSNAIMELLEELEENDMRRLGNTYNCLLDICVSAGAKEAVSGLFTKMKASGDIDAVSYNTLLKDVSCSPIVESQVLDEMRSLNLRPTAITYNSLANIAVGKGDYRGAWSIISRMEEDGFPVDSFTCSIMMKSLRQSSSKDGVDNILSLIDRSSVILDDVLVGALLDACARLRDESRLTTALTAIKQSGATLSDMAYTTIIRAYGHARALDKAMHAWNEMRQNHIYPSEQTVGAMVDACVSNGAVEDAYSACLALKESISGYVAPASAQNSLIKGFTARKESALALQVYEEMKSNRVELPLVTFNSLIDACARSGDIERAVELFEDMCSLGVLPDLVTYSTIIKGHCVKGDLQQALQLFTFMRKKDIVPDAVLFNSILDGCARKQMPSLAEQILTDMETSGVTPNNSTLSILVKLYGKARDLDTAFSIVESLPAKYGFVPGAQVHTGLLAACISCGRMGQASEVFERIADPDAKAFGALITGYLKHGDVRSAGRMLQRAVDTEVVVTAETVRNVLFMIDRRRLNHEFSSLIKRLEDKGLHSCNRDTSPSEGSDGEPRVRSTFQVRREASQTWRNAV